MPTRRIALATTLTALALPASALAAATHHGTVLSVNRAAHAVQVVESAHVVHAYRYGGQTALLHAGSEISFHPRGVAMTGVRLLGSSRKVAFDATVVRSSSQRLVLRLADGHTVRFSAGQLAHTSAVKHQRSVTAVAHIAATAGVRINFAGLAAGATVLVTETVGTNGSVTISITVLSHSAAGSGSGTGTGSTGTGTDQSITGVVTDVETDTFTVETGDGSSLVFHMAASALAAVNMDPCDTVDVGYHVVKGQLDADTVNDSGSGGSASSSCNADWEATASETGPVTRISNSSITITTSDKGAMTFAVDPNSSLSQGFLVGDTVVVTYVQDPNGTLQASDIEYNENDSLGIVTAVSAGSVTMTDDSTGQADTFTADPSEEQFDAIAVGDHIDVTWHESGTAVVVDEVDDLTADAASGGADGGAV